MTTVVMTVEAMAAVGKIVEERTGAVIGPLPVAMSGRGSKLLLRLTE